MNSDTSGPTRESGEGKNPRTGRDTSDARRGVISQVVRRSPNMATRQLILVLVVALLAAACGNAVPAISSPVTTQAVTATPEAVTLKLAATGGFAPAQVDDLVASIAERSKNAVQIEVVEEPDFMSFVDPEKWIIEAVGSGDVDLGWVGSRAFAELGVANFNALTAPFLIDSYELEQAVLDSDIPGRMLEGLDELGVTGLAVVGGGMRRPAAVNAPILGADDYSGITFHTWRSSVNADTIEALGATHTAVTGWDRDEGLNAGTIDGYENTLAFFAGKVALAPYISVNVVLWPATGVLVANPRMLDGLTESQRRLLEEAVAASVERSIGLANVDAEQLAGICSQGGRFAEATGPDLQSMRAAVNPVYLRLAENAETAAYIAEIEALKTTVSPEALTIPDGCTGESPIGEALVAQGTDDPGLLNGSYRIEWSVAELVTVLQMSEAEAQDNAGVFKLTLENGRFEYVWEDLGYHCAGTYGVSGAHISMVSSSDLREWECGTDSLGTELVNAAWELGNGQLVLSDFSMLNAHSPFFSVFLGTKPFAID